MADCVENRGAPKIPFSAVAQTVGLVLRRSKMLDLSTGID